MAYIFVVNNNLSEPWEGQFQDIQLNRLTDEYFYSAEDLDGKPEDVNVTDIKGRLCVYDWGGLGRAPMDAKREWILFALGMCSLEGYPSIPLGLETKGSKVNKLVDFERIKPLSDLKLNRALDEKFFLKLLHCIKAAYSKKPDRIGITVSRYNKYIVASSSMEGLLDLTICLESLFSAESEISYRFSLGLVRLLEYKGADAVRYFDLFRDLYAFRSKFVHGDPVYEKIYNNKLAPQHGRLRVACSKALTIYITYLKDNKFQTWSDFLKRKVVSV